VTLILASLSTARRAMLSAAGVQFQVMAAPIDEDTAKASLRAQGLNARDLADALAELKAMRTAIRKPDAIILGCDQTLMCDDGTMLDKSNNAVPGNGLADQLRLLSGRTHHLFSAVVAVDNGQPVWRHVDRAKLTMRPLSAGFIKHYVASEGNAVAGCVGGYRIEGFGAQLFSKIEGSHFTIMGLPLLPLLDWLRVRGVLTS
jgi:septum formation protein